MRRIFFGIILVCFAVIAVSASQAQAITNKDLSGKTWLFTMEVAADGFVYDTDTVMLDKRWTKTELKEALKTITVGTPISYANISIFRLKIEGLPEDWSVIVYFDAAGYSLYGYVMPTKISPEKE